MRHIEGLAQLPRRLVSAFRRLRALLAAPQMLTQLSQDIIGLRELIRFEYVRHWRKVEGEFKAELTAQLGFTFHDLEQQLNLEWEKKFNELVSRLGGLNPQFNVIANALSEVKNLLHHLNTSAQARFNALENEKISYLHQQLHELAAIQLRSVTLMKQDQSEWIRLPEEMYAPAIGKPFDFYLALAKKEFPHAYPLWKERVDAMFEAFLDTKVGSATQGGDVYSRLFRSFVELYGRGRILDVGCGIFGRPYYLRAYPAELISGIDPLLPVAPLDFEFVRGISEHLPWPDDSFSTVISAISLDHCMSLEQSLAEIRRVLRTGGRFLLWVRSNPGSPRYQSDCSDFPGIDQFHLFHFDVSWFSPMIDRMFDVVDCIQLHTTGHSHVMYCLVNSKLNLQL